MTNPTRIHAVHWSPTTQRLRIETLYLIDETTVKKGKPGREYEESVYLCNREPDGSGQEYRLTGGQVYGLNPADDSLHDGDGCTWFTDPQPAFEGALREIQADLVEAEQAHKAAGRRYHRVKLAIKELEKAIAKSQPEVAA